MKKRLLCSLAFLAMAVSTVPAHAISLTPGSTVALSVTTVAARPELAGTVIVDDMKSFSATNALGETLYTGQIQIRIVREDVAGTLDFYFRVFNDETSTDAIERVSHTNFAGWTTDVDWRIDGLGDAAPAKAERSLSGGTVSFTDFKGEGHGILPGEQSKFYFIKTTATNFKAGSTSILNGGIATVKSYAPAVPEPSSMILLGSGLIGLAAWGRKRLNKA